MKLSDYLKELRKNKKKSLRQVEKDTGISNAHLSQFEQDKIKKPSLENLQKLASYYEVDVKELVNLSEGKGKTGKSTFPKTYEPLSIVQASDLISFADLKRSEGIIPKIVRELIVSTVDYNFLKMPKEDSVHLPGWDGQLMCKDGFGNQFVPDGFSYWEVGKNKDVKAKATSDIKKRQQDPLGAKPEESTYIFVTPRRWPGKKDDWIAKMRSEGVTWNDIRVIDAEDLELWFEQSPSVALKFSRFIGKYPLAGALPLQTYWDEWFQSTEPGIDESLLLEAGQNCIPDISSFFENLGTNQHILKAHDISAAIAFIYSAITDLKDLMLRESLLSRAIVVENNDAFRALSLKTTSLLLIPTFEGAPIGAAKNNGHRIIVPSSEIKDGDQKVISRVAHSSVSSYLEEEGGFPEDKAKRFASKSHGNLSILRRLLSQDGEVERPKWCEPGKGIELAPFVLFGSWSSANEYDIAFISNLIGKDYSELEKELQSVLMLPDSPLKKYGNTYTFYQEFAFSNLCEFIDYEFIKKFIEYSSKTLLSEYNDKYDLDKEERFSAAILGKGVSSSSSLRTGIARSYALLANYDLPNSENIKALVREAVKEILTERKDWQYWASISDVLMLLTEAAPEIFLQKLSEACVSEEFYEVFNQTTIMGGCDYSSLLWSLELCAWEKQYLKQSTAILFEMSKYENKGNNYVNQPSNSLWSIYRVWNPQTSCSFQERLTILNSLKGDYFDEVWSLLQRMIPDHHEWGSPSYKARYRDIQLQMMETNTYQDLYNLTHTVCDEIIGILNNKPGLWIDAVDCVFKIPTKNYALKFLNLLNDIDLTVISETTKVKIWKKIEEKYSSHLEFQDAAWSFKGTALKLMGEIYEKFTPTNPIVRWTHVFDFGFNHPSIEKIRGNYEKRHEDIKDLQKKALGEIISSGDYKSSYNLIQDVPRSDTLGDALAEILDKSTDKEEIITSFDFKKSDKDKVFYVSFVFRCFYKESFEWITNILKEKQLDTERTVAILSSLPFEKKVWDLVELQAANIKDLYWNTIEGRRYIDDVDEALWISEKFLSYKRPLIAFDIISNLDMKKKFDDVPTGFLMNVLDEVVNCDLASNDWIYSKGMFDYHLEKVLKNLGKREDADKRKLALIEWNFMPLFSYGKKPEYLTSEVNKDPNMFIDILKFAYKEDVEFRDDADEKTSNEIFKRAYNFLHGYKTLPGTNENGEFDPDYFRDWIMKVRELCDKCNRAKIGDHVLGNLFAHAPHDTTDYQWPHSAVRDIIEKYNSREMNSGFRIGIFNKRGVVTKSCYEGGEQERKLADKYFGWASNLEVLWPVTAGLLKQVGNGYIADAKDADIRAKLDRHKND